MPGRVSTYDGERCSIVTCSAVPAIAGTSVIAVAPDVLRHRVLLSYRALAEGMTSSDLVQRLTAAVPLP